MAVVGYGEAEAGLEEHAVSSFLRWCGGWL